MLTVRLLNAYCTLTVRLLHVLFTLAAPPNQKVVCALRARAASHATLIERLVDRLATHSLVATLATLLPPWPSRVSIFTRLACLASHGRE